METKQWGQLFDRVVDAAFSTVDEAVGREDILAHLRGGTLVPGRYLYASDSGADNWIRLCGDPMYRHHRETVEFWANSGGRHIAGLIHEYTRRDDLDYVSLGPGAGEKDAELARHWLDSGIDLFYYPYDISRVLLKKAVRAVRDAAPQQAHERLRMKAVMADFGHLTNLTELFRHRDSPNVIGLLGSLGNLDNELVFLRRLRQQMSEDDILVIEVRLRSETDMVTELTDGDAALRFDFGPLESYLGLSFDPELMTVTQESGVSSIGGDTLTTVVGCKNIKYAGTTYPKVKLIYIHQYTERTFIDALTRRCSFELLDSRVGGDTERFLVCAVRLKRPRR